MCSLPLPHTLSNRKPETDLEILKGSVKNPWLFGVLVERYERPFLRKASYILHSQELSEDAVQDTFLKIYKNAEKFAEQPNASFSSWAYRILINTCYSLAERKTQESGRVAKLDFSDLDALRCGDGSVSGDEASFVYSVLRRMPAKFSRLLELYFFEDRSYAEISETEKLSLSAVKSGLHRAKKQFKSVAIEMI